MGLCSFGAGPTRGLADTGYTEMGANADNSSRKFENKSNKMRIYTVPALKLRGGLNSVASFTSKIKFPDFKWVPFMPYTYNTEGRCDRTDCHLNSP